MQNLALKNQMNPLQKNLLSAFFRSVSRFLWIIAFFFVAEKASATGVCHSHGVLNGSDTVIFGDRVSIGHSSIVQGKITAGKFIEIGYDGVVGDSVFSGKNVVVHDRAFVSGAIGYAGSINLGAATQIMGSYYKDPAMAICSSTQDSGVNPGTTGYEVPYDGALDLQPGNWGDVKVHSRSVLILHPGVYQFKSLVFEPDAFAQLQSGADHLMMRVANEFTWGDRVTWKLLNSQTDSSVAAMTSIFAATQGEIYIGYNSVFLGDFWAPHAKVTLNSRTKFVGSWSARYLIVGSDLTLYPQFDSTSGGNVGNTNPTTPTDSNGSSNSGPSNGQDSVWHSGGCLDSFSLYGHNGVLVGDRSIVNGVIGSGQNFTLGNDAKLLSNVVNIGDFTLGDRSGVVGKVRIDGRIIRGADISLNGGVILDTSLMPCVIPRLSVNPGFVGMYFQGIDSLLPGEWNDVVVQSGSTLRIKSGLYQIHNLTLQPDAVLEVQDSTGILDFRVDGSFNWGDRVRIRTKNSTPDTLLAARIFWYLNAESAITIGNDGALLGTVLAPNAYLDLGSRTNYVGRWFANKLHLEPDVVVQSISALSANSKSSVKIIQPKSGFWTNASGLTVVWSVKGAVQTSGTWEDLPLQDGLYFIKRCAGGLCDSVQIHVKRTPPDVQFISPANGSILSVTSVPLVWTVDGVSHLDTVRLAPGWNSFTRCAEDSAKNTACARIRILQGSGSLGSVRFNPAPDIYPGSVSVALSPISTGGVVYYTIDGSDPDSNSMRFNGNPIVFDTVGEYLIKAREYSKGVLGQISEGFYGVTPAGITADPTAPTLDTTVVPLPWEKWNFIWNSASRSQKDVKVVFDPNRIMHLSGQVLGPNTRPLPRVKVSVVGHPEYGSTRTRSNGEWDMVVNSGGNIDVLFSMEGLFPVRRIVSTFPHQSIRVEQVRLVSPSQLVTVLDVSGASKYGQIAMGDPQEDKDGFRQANLIIPPYVKASLVGPGVNDTTPVKSLGIRITEYTVGTKGQNSIPATLPQNVANAYTLEISADEARLKGAEVHFSGSVALYTNNFKGFPVGTKVPLGWYDRTRGMWVPEFSGKVVKIKRIVNGVAWLTDRLDGTESDSLNGSNTTEERTQLARLYGIEAMLWRVSFNHLTPWSMNWGFVLPTNATPWQGKLQKDQWDPQGCSAAGCEVDVQNQALSKSIDLAGSGEDLIYRSDRVSGRVSANQVVVPLTGSVVHPALNRIEVSFLVDGKEERHTYYPEPNLSASFLWNGTDRWGRTVEGNRPATMDIGFVYQANYRATSAFGGGVSGVDSFQLTGNGAEITRWSHQSFQLGMHHSKTTGLGGWELRHHHWFDPEAKVLYFGDGRRLQAADQGNILEPVHKIPGHPFWSSSMDQLPNGSLIVAGYGGSSLIKYNIGNSNYELWHSRIFCG